MNARDYLNEARATIQDRGLDYGHPSDNMQRTAALWASYLEMPITDYQVAMCMALVKIARSMETAKSDTYIDLAAYVAIAGQLHTEGGMNSMFNLEEYTTVAERIKSFRQMFPMGRILTFLIHEDANRVVFKAELYRDDQDEYPFSTGYAREITAERGVNRDFALENCETSAIGIAAKNADIGTEKKSISREEAAKVNKVLAKDKVIQDTKVKMAETSQQYIPVAKADDPWTTWEASPVQTLETAVEMVQQALGGTAVDESCVHGARVWRTGTSKAGKQYGAWYCSGSYNGVLLNSKEKCDPNWYEIAKDGTWKPQVKR